jgi:hypothetical protein
MAIAILLCLRFFVFEVSAIQTQGQLDFRLIRVACDRTVSPRIRHLCCLSIEFTIEVNVK